MSVKEAPISVAEDCDCSRGVLLTDYLPTSCICIVDDYDKCLESIDEFQKIGLDIAGARLDAGTMQKEEAGIYFPAFHVASFLSSSNIFMSLVPKNMKNLSFKRLVESDTHIQPGFHGKWDDLLFTIKSLVSSNKRVVLMAGSQDRLELLERWVRKQELPMIVRHSVEEEPSSGVVVLALGSGENGFSCETIRLVLFTEAELYGKPKVRQIRRKKVKIPLDWRQLSAGDYVVHIHHGVGRLWY